MATISKERLAELLAKAQLIKAAREQPIPTTATSNLNGSVERASVTSERRDTISTQDPNSSNNTQPVTATTTTVTTDKYGNSITYNTQQQAFIDLATTGQSCVLIGAAGTGKTTCMKGTVTALIQSGRAGTIESDGHKHLIHGTPGIVIVAYTRRAVNNIRRNMPEDMQGNCITIHKLLEYAPVSFTITDPETGEEKNKFQFLPSRNTINPLPPSIHTIIFEESSMIGTPLYQEVMEACPHNPQQIFLGDICQLPPVFGPAILGFKLSTLPVVELTEVYRQALESPIIRLAHRILSGKPIEATEFAEWKTPDQLTLHPWKKALHADIALLTLAKFFEQAIKNNVYDPEEDIILIPFNKSCGTDELNKHIANFIARTRKAVTHEIIAGFNKHYFSVGDKCMFEKEDCIIQSIKPNIEYSGATYKTASSLLDYWGHIQIPSDPSMQQPLTDDQPQSDDDIDFLLAQAAAVGDEDRVRAASHVITLLKLDSGTEVTVDTSADINNLSLGYALTVHKSQGSEWRKVFCCFHQSHATMIQRELLYTAITRAREELYVICEPDTFVKGINNQRIKGNTLAEKAEYFKGKYSDAEAAKFSSKQ